MPLNEGMYPYTAKEARERGELELWRANFRANCACAGAIELAIRRDFDGMHLKDGAVEDAFRAAHTLKGLCLTLGFSALAKPSIELTELLRGRRMDGYEPLYEQVVTEYEKTVAALRQVD